MKILGLIETTSRLTLGAVFLMTGIAKVRHPYDFLNAVFEYQLFGPSGSFAVAAIIPCLEIILGLCMIYGFFKLPSSYWALAIGIGFIGVQVSTLARGLSTDCGCYGGHTHLDKIGVYTLGRAAFVVVLSIIIIFANRNLHTTTFDEEQI